MGAIKSRVYERIVMGITGGGQISIPILAAHFADACDEFYERTEALEAEFPAIDEVKGTSQYQITSLPNSGRPCRMVKVERNGVELAVSAYQLKKIVPSDGAESYTALVLVNSSPETATGSLVVTAKVAYKVDDYIIETLTQDAEVAIASKIMAVLGLETGKPWFDTTKAALEENKFLAACSRAKHKVLRGHGGGTLQMRPTNQGFIV